MTNTKQITTREIDNSNQQQLANWSRIRRIAGMGGTYLYGSVARLGVDSGWLRTFYAQAAAQQCRARECDGYLYVDVLGR